MDKGRELRDEALARVEAGAREWVAQAHISADRVLERARGTRFTTDDIWADLEDRGIDPPAEPRAMGPVARRLRSKADVVDYTTSERSICHRRIIPVYRAKRVL